MAKGFWIALAALTLLVSAPAPALAQSDGALLRTIREFGDMTGGQGGGGGPPVDKILTFGRQGDEVMVTGMAVSPPGQWPALPEGALAILRTRASAAEGNRMPSAADLDFVRRTRARLFIVGEWSTPPVIWEIALQREGVRFRAIDGGGRGGRWQTPVLAPAAASRP
jgi:hypothetical protein